MRDLLELLLNSYSPSGGEIALQKELINHMNNYSDKIITDYSGNVTAVINPDSDFKIMLDAHIDEVSFTVTDITDEGFLKVSRNGGINYKIAPGKRVKVHAKDGIIKGVIGIIDDSKETKVPKECKDLYIDICYSSKESVQSIVSVGDYVTYDYDLEYLANNYIVSRALDDKLGVYIIMEVLKNVRNKTTNGVYALSAVSEETTGKGAYYASTMIKPNLSISVDVTFASDYSDRSKVAAGAVSLSKGPVICLGSLLNKKINEKLKEVALKHNIDVQYELSNGLTYTNLDIIYKQNGGVENGLVSIPLRYMHSPSELACLDDVDAIIKLLTNFILEINEEFSLNPFE